MGLQQNKFNKGDLVYEISSPQHLMMITQCRGIIYYCKMLKNLKSTEAAYMERDLKRYNKNELFKEA